MECIKKRICLCAGVRYRSRSNVAASAAAAADDDDVADVFFLCVRPALTAMRIIYV